MSALLQKIRIDSLTARKARSEPAATVLVTLLAAVLKIGKDDGNREPTEAEAIKTVKTFSVGLTESIAVLEKTIATAPTDRMKEQLARAKAELAILVPYVPEQLDEKQLSLEISCIVAGLKERSPKAIGIVMSSLKAQFDGRYDGALAKNLTVQALAAQS